MTVIKKLATAQSRSEPGVRFHCDICGSDITSTVRIRCAHPACTEYDLCVPCFTNGNSSGAHNPATHPYQVIEQHSYPIFTPDWGADEELLLLEGAETYGLGSWADIAEHIGGGRDKDEVKQHYIDTYINSSKFPLPELCDPREFGGLDTIPRDEFQARKKRRIEQKKAASQAVVPKKKPTASVPACHEVSGYMPGRMEFDVEFENDAEQSVATMFFDPGEGINPVTGQLEPETELKLTIMDIYNSRLTVRAMKKKIIFEHQLLEYRKLMQIEKKRSKEEKDLLNRVKPYARLMNKRDYDEFSEGVLQEYQLRFAIKVLQDWRKAGITSMDGGLKYEVEKMARTNAMKSNGPLDRATQRMSKANQQQEGPGVAAVQHLLESTPPELITPAVVAKPNTTSGPLVPTSGNSNAVEAKPMRKVDISDILSGISYAPLNLTNENVQDLQLLSEDEQKLCSVLRIKPKPYMAIKELLIREAIKQGGVLKKKAAREMCKIDVNKTSRIHAFFVSNGWIGKA
ncbi:transcriptional adaptor-like protein [Ascobolus immersus RN42]|uniref:Transcriptional adapter 2 n=1 Tax=Ascobolus immersus RN42 TaxID=1160509 RepID=A0A3N4IT99_ASCIM|nr:transcriptional adaptor-like protein [Ascobolus immersus RN42]